MVLLHILIELETYNRWFLKITYYLYLIHNYAVAILNVVLIYMIRLLSELGSWI